MDNSCRPFLRFRRCFTGTGGDPGARLRLAPAYPGLGGLQALTLRHLRGGFRSRDYDARAGAGITTTFETL